MCCSFWRERQPGGIMTEKILGKMINDKTMQMTPEAMHDLGITPGKKKIQFYEDGKGNAYLKVF